MSKHKKFRSPCLIARPGSNLPNCHEYEYCSCDIKELEQKLSDSEADWIKMRDIAEETQRKMDEALKQIENQAENIKWILSGAFAREAIEVIRFYGDERNWATECFTNDDDIEWLPNNKNSDDLWENVDSHGGKKARDFLAKIEGNL